MMFLLLGTLLIIRLLVIVNISFHHWSCGLMDRASVSDTGDCRFKSCQGSFFFLAGQTAHILADIVLKLTHIQKAIRSPSEASSPPKDRVA